MRRRRVALEDSWGTLVRAFLVFPVLHTEDDPEMFYPPDTDPGQAAVTPNFQDIGYGLHAGAFDSRGGHYRFLNVRLEQGAPIRSAHLLLWGQSSPETGEHSARYVGLDEDDAARLSAAGGGTDNENRYADWASRAKTAAQVDWTTTPKTSATPSTSWISPELRTIIAEITERPGWSSGNALALTVQSILDPYRIQDTFTDDDSTPLQSHSPDTGSGWTKEGAGDDIDIQSNKIKSTASAGNDSEQYTEDTVFSHNQYEILFDVTSSGLGAGDGINIYFNWTDSSNHYVLEIRHNQNWVLRKVISGTPTQLASAAPTAHDASFSVKIHVHHAGGSLQVIKDGSEYVLGDKNDDITAPGQVGLQFIDNTYRIDNFDVRGGSIFLTALKFNTGSGAQYSPRLIVKRAKEASKGVAGSQPAATGALTAKKQAVRILAGNQPAPIGILARIAQALRALAGDQPTATGALARIEQALRAVAGSQPAATATLARVRQQPRSIAGSQPASTGTLARIEQAVRAVAGDQPTSTGVLSRIEQALRAAAGSQPSATGTLDASKGGTRSLAGSQPSAAGALARILQQVRLIAGSQPAPTGALARIEQAVRALTGSQPAATGVLTRIEQALRALAGDQPASTGALARIQQRTRALAGNEPAAVGTVSAQKVTIRSLAGEQPTATGALSRLGQHLRATAGNQPAATGALARFMEALRALTGAQPAATGILVRIEQPSRSLAGDQPAASGELARAVLSLNRELSGSQPAATGSLARMEQALRSVAGDQPASTGALSRSEQALRALAGNQPAATGIVTRIEQAVRALAGDQPAATGGLVWIVAYATFNVNTGTIAILLVLDGSVSLPAAVQDGMIAIGEAQDGSVSLPGAVNDGTISIKETEDATI